MKLDGSSRSSFVSISVAFVICVVAFANGLEAHPPRAPQSQVQVSVAGHLALEGIRVKQIFVQQRGTKYYLLLRRADKNGFAIVNVTDPGNPVLADRNALPEPAGENLDLPAPGLVRRAVRRPPRLAIDRRRALERIAHRGID